MKISGLKDLVRAAYEDDKIVNCEQAFTRELYLQMQPHSIFQESLVGLLNECPLTSMYLQGVSKTRVSITGFTAFGKKPFRKHIKKETPSHNPSSRKLVVESARHVRPEDLASSE
jgi:hypothetical protein